MINRVVKNSCVGCGACANACPSDNIFMQSSREGFLYPNKKEKCSECGICEKSCPILNPLSISENQYEPQVYAAWSLDEEIRFNSTSGGVFTELAKAVIYQDGCVVGAKYNENHLVEHDIVENIKDISLLRQSKYIQSETKDVFRRIEKKLQNDKVVLFVGTPCQCAGLICNLQKSYENLILCDFICRGVNSPMVFLKYLAELQKEFRSSVKQVWFKNKQYGWNNFSTKIIFEDGQEYLRGRDTDLFMHGYIKNGLNLYMRPSCGECRFKGIKRPVDITMGDFWGVKLTESDDNTENGVSVVIVHTETGLSLIKSISHRIYIEEHNINDVLYLNRCLTTTIEASDKSDAFYNILRNESFSRAIQSVIDTSK